MKLKDLEVGTTFDAGPIDVRILEHFDDGKTLLIADTCIAERHFADQSFKTRPEKPASNPNDWRFSSLNRELNTEFLDAFDQAKGPIRSKDILTADWSLADHKGGEGYGTIQAKIALLTEVMYEKYADQDFLEHDDWWWLITPYASFAEIARYVNTDGSLIGNYAYGGNRGVRPAFFVESDIDLSTENHKKRETHRKCMTRKAPKKAIIIEHLSQMPYDYRGMHATGRRIFVPVSVPSETLFSWDEYSDGDGNLVYANR